MEDAAVNVVVTATMGVSSILMPKVVFKSDNWNEFRRDVDNCFLYNGWASALTSPDDPATFKALIVLRRQVAQEYQIELSDCENAKVAWDHLKNIGERSSSAKLIVLMRTLHSLKMQSEENVYQYFARGKELRQMLADAGEKIEERVLVLALLTGLTNRFRTFVDIIMVTGEILKLEVLLPKLVAVESFESQLGASGDGALALFSGSGRNRNWPSCRNCGKMGHTAEKCWRDKPCSSCGKTGHDDTRCFKKRREQSKDPNPVGLIL